MNSPEQFDPTDRDKYKKTEDLPPEHQPDFVNYKAGFISKEAAQEYQDIKKRRHDPIQASHELAERRDEIETAITEARKVIGDGLEWAEDLKQHGLSAATDLAKKIDLKKRSCDKGEENSTMIRELITTILSAQTRKVRYGNIVEALADVWINLKKPKRSMVRMNWTHANGSEIGKLSKHAETHGAAKRLANEAIRIAVEDGSDSCIDRVVFPMVEWNFDHLSNSDVDKPFAVHPDSNLNPEYNDQFGGTEGAFLISSTPREFMERVVKEKLYHPIDSKKLIEALLLCRDTIHEEALREYLSDQLQLQDQQDISLESILNNMNAAESAQEIEQGIFVDVGGTLIREGKLQETLLNYLEEESAYGSRVIIFTGGDPEQATNQLRSLGLPEKFLPVASKTAFRGKVLERLIDDTPAQYQGFKAQSTSLY